MKKKKKYLIIMKKKNIANFYFVIEKRKTSSIKGPPVTLTKNLTKFKNKHSKIFIKKSHTRMQRDLMQKSTLIFILLIHFSQTQIQYHVYLIKTPPTWQPFKTKLGLIIQT